MLRLLPFHLCVCGVILKQQNVSDQVNRSISVSSFQRPEMEYLSFLLWACDEFTLHHMDDEVSVPILNWAIDQIGNFVAAVPQKPDSQAYGSHSYLPRP